jgi:hypothetical protein
MIKKFDFFTASDEFINIDEETLGQLIENYTRDGYNVLRPWGNGSRCINGQYDENSLTAYYEERT